MKTMTEDLPLEMELHSYVDGTLDDEAMARIEEYLTGHPEAAARVRDYLKQKAQIASFGRRIDAREAPGDLAALERQLLRRLKHRGLLRWQRLAATAVLITAGWVGHSLYQELADGPNFADEVVQAYMLTTSEPEEIMLLSPERIERLFARIGEMEYLPDLSRFGYEPIGAQLLPSDAGAMLHVPYRSANGTVLSYFLLHDEAENEVPRHILHRNGVSLAYWQHEHSRYAVAALLEDDELNTLTAYVETAPNLFATP
ncbi:MAG TPA: hypothetical protein VMR74_08240 [Gammaproteobacteria bacterium]|nr:hypothetical protein [Gammaproteobacteria bacterium]